MELSSNMQFSLTLQGLLTLVVGTILRSAGQDMPDPEVAAFVATGIQFVGAIMVYIGRVRHGDITWYGVKK